MRVYYGSRELVLQAWQEHLDRRKGWEKDKYSADKMRSAAIKVLGEMRRLSEADKEYIMSQLVF